MLDLLEHLTVSTDCGLELLELLLCLLTLCLQLVACLVHTLQGLLDLLDSRPILIPSHLLGSSGLLRLNSHNLVLLYLLLSVFELGLEHLKLS